MMKGLVVYDSVHGNTKLVAESITKQIKDEGHQAEMIGLRDGTDNPMDGDYMFIGSPTRMGKMTPRAKKFLNSLNRELWSDKPIFIFDTYGPVPKSAEERKKKNKWLEPGAAGKLQKLLKEKGFNVSDELLRCEVTGIKGPLGTDELNRAKKYTHDSVTNLIPTGS
jgi:flavodoxin